MNGDEIDYYLDDLLDLLIENKKFDLIIPIARRGIETIKLSKKYINLVENGKIVFFDSIFTNPQYLIKKRIVLFDEAVSSGAQLTEKSDQLFRLLRKRCEEIKTAALIVNDDPSIKKPDYYCDELVFSHA